jgi:hypothetical protein
VIYSCFTGAELFAGISLSYRTMLGMKIAAQPENTKYSGVLFKEQNGKYVTRLSMEREVNLRIAQRLKDDFDLVRFRFPPGPVNLQSFIWEGFLPSVKYTYIIQLDKSAEDIWKEMDEKRKGNVRKAETDGITIIPSDNFNQAYQLIEKTMNRKNTGLPSKTVMFNHDRMLVENKQCKAFMAKDRNGDNIAAAYVVWDHKRCHYLFSGNNGDGLHSGAVALATWKAIEYSKNELGLKEFDFQGSMIPEIERFIRGFGGRQIVQYIVTWAKPHLKVVLYPYLIFTNML